MIGAVTETCEGGRSGLMAMEVSPEISNRFNFTFDLHILS